MEIRLSSILCSFCLILLCLYETRAATEEEIPRYIGCTDTSDCGNHQCCFMGYGRYATPSCAPRLEPGQACHPNHKTMNVTVTYPDNFTISLTNIYQAMCPCQPGLACVIRGEAYCDDTALVNSIDYPDENQRYNN